MPNAKNPHNSPATNTYGGHTRTGHTGHTHTGHTHTGRFSDPLLVHAYGSVLTEEGHGYYRRSIALVILSGMIEGLALLTVVPLALTWSTGTPTLGLGVGGWISVLAALAVTGLLTAYVQAVMAYTAAMDVIRHSLSLLGDQLSRLPLGWFRSGWAGTLSRLVTDGLMAIGQGIAHFTTPIIRNATAALVLLVGMWIWQWQLGLALTVAFPLLCALAAAARVLRRRSELATSTTESDLADRIVEYARCQPILRATGQAATFAPLHTAVKANLAAQRRSLWLGIAANLLSGVGAQLLVVSLIALAVHLCTGGLLNPAATLAFLGVALRFMRNLEDFTSFVMATEVARTPLESMHEVLDAPVPSEPASDVALPTPGEVALTDVRFGYRADTPVLNGVSFTAQPGTLTAIVGPSGAGKSTLFRLMCRFWDVDGGSVKIGGVDVRDQTTAQLMAQLSMVFQDVYLYDDTLEANIRVGRENATDAEVRAAADMAGVSDIAARLPGGWESPVGERGGMLSGGERQRVSIARALLKHAPIVLFDEATSALDPENTAAIRACIQQLRQEATVLVIAHKLETVQGADQIVVLDASGTVREVGTHAELLESGGLYRKFWEDRRRAAGWQLGAAAD
ncbi:MULTISPECIES: ABC transporter ATP-binding protein [Actinotignum]|uniref:ABC transporter ATP-binding protein n=1 Tax=Actinotignum TaxID=1653174 RepID=UPI002A836A4A|nr:MULTISPECIES: ABC transporter ATP-binding protein [Actinotignum]MDY5128305.1 ABC transporter ATP-binding protein [Actinotignum sp. SLA_B059]MDY5145364.1 ABC transporter ATP-binding protein [Actinotignum timonense]